jgi:mono/diheme cytochrome c family protein
MIRTRALCLDFTGIAIMMLVFACTTPPVTPTATPTAGTIETVEHQSARGEPIYQQTCTGCHGLQGEGQRRDSTFAVWPLVGADFQARNPNAQVVFDVVRSKSAPNLRALTDAQIYDAIAYVWSLNDPERVSPITAENAASIAPGETVEALAAAGIYPPLGNALHLVTLPTAIALQTVSNGYIGMRVDQVTAASAIGNITTAPGDTFVIVVFALQDLTDHPLDLDPKFLQLKDAQKHALEPQPIELTSPIEHFRTQTIQPEHGTAAIAVFAGSVGMDRQLVYDDQTGHPLVVSLGP